MAQEDPQSESANQISCATELCNEDIPEILAARKANPIRFSQQYVEKMISGTMRVDDIEQNFLTSKIFYMELSDNNGNRVRCKWDSDDTLEEISLQTAAALNIGDMTFYLAVIESTSGSLLTLRQCTMAGPL
jgi:hypothetical protein